MNNDYDREEVVGDIPTEFNSPEEYTTWCVNNLAQAITNLSTRITNLEMIIQKIPPPGADMIQYKIPGTDDYKNVKELFDDIYSKIESK